jgi:hypothetical protein
MTDVRCRVFGHRYRFTAAGAELSWACVRCGEPGGAKVYDSAEDAERYAAGLNREDREDLGRRAPLIGLLPLRIFRHLRRRSRVS